MSSNPERDKNPNNHSDSSDPENRNPFIKFRQFADAQIGSLLQGIVGLPSAFSKDPSHHNTRWADFDQELRRRDELQARQRQLKEADPGRPNQHQQISEEEREEEIPVKTWQARETSSNTNRDTSGEMDENAARDIPLYSPVSKSLFAHLHHCGDNEPDWKPSNFWNSLTGRLLPEYWPFKLRAEQCSSDAMRTIQYLAYNELNGTQTFCSDYSLLPYLLFSPYSPVKLSTSTQPGLSSIPWDLAFEDLIRTTHGSPVSSSSLQPSFFHFHPAMVRADKAVHGMSWIQKLYESNLLQQKEARMVQQRVYWPSPWSRPSLETVKSGDNEGETEQDMYDHFLRWVSSPTAVVDAVGSVFKDSDGLFNKLMALDTPEGKQALREMLDSKVAKSVTEMLEELERLGSASRSREGQDDTVFKTSTKPSPLQDRPNSVLSTDSPQEKNRVVSTSTSSERRTNEDGSVETTVTVWKRFADGRESCTTTHHCEDPAAIMDWEGAQVEKQPVENTERKTKRGWFWN
ncbi:uncharacterized protein BP5553_00909 [Venustampulla echinocandica]|uniref:Uncharacterized protein n=1 Tax=Venustampulla echinocandica TaxID=2656787 RepID=A0A370TZJ8_9HELO|nr:uncharacterized protein BP5553_00909 [Venustampulla echinocandica]RDL40930.1 hypothetical protein BP5553_00909 [Venustampulla echinocandica]